MNCVQAVKSLTFNGIVIESRTEDNYINATQMCKAGGKQFNDWCRLGVTRALIQALVSETGISGSLLVDVKKGNTSLYSQGSWIHPDLAVQLAQWISPSFAIQVSRWIRELFTCGTVSINSSRTDEEMKQLELECHNLKREHVETTQRLQQIEQKFEQERQEFKRRELRMKDFIDTTKKIEKLQVIYIGASDAYESQNRYKVGGCRTLPLLESRFATYNSRSAGGDLFFCAYYRLVHDYTDIEKRVSTLLSGFKDTKITNKEMYHIHGESLRLALDFIIDNADRDVEWFNEHLHKFTNSAVDAAPYKSTPISLGRKSLCITAGDKKVTVCDITDWTQEQIDVEISAILNIYKERKSLTVLDDQLVLWREFAGIIRELHRGTKMEPWRKLFRENLPRRSERLRLKWAGKVA